MLEWVRGICEWDAVNSHVTINKGSVHHHWEVKTKDYMKFSLTFESLQCSSILFPPP